MNEDAYLRLKNISKDLHPRTVETFASFWSSVPTSISVQIGLPRLYYTSTSTGWPSDTVGKFVDWLEQYVRLFGTDTKPGPSKFYERVEGLIGTLSADAKAAAFQEALAKVPSAWEVLHKWRCGAKAFRDCDGHIALSCYPSDVDAPSAIDGVHPIIVTDGSVDIDASDDFSTWGLPLKLEIRSGKMLRVRADIAMWFAASFDMTVRVDSEKSYKISPVGFTCS